MVVLTLTRSKIAALRTVRQTIGDALRAALETPIQTRRRRRSFAVSSNKVRPTRKILQVFKVGCPIRKSMDQSLFAAPHSLSQRITSFFACACQGIHQMPLRHLIVLIANAHHLCPNDKPKFVAKGDAQVTFYNPRFLTMPSTCSTSLLFWGHAERPACKPVFKTSFSR